VKWDLAIQHLVWRNPDVIVAKIGGRSCVECCNLLVQQGSIRVIQRERLTDRAINKPAPFGYPFGELSPVIGDGLVMDRAGRVGQEDAADTIRMKHSGSHAGPATHGLADNGGGVDLGRVQNGQ
ncbi:uncharacterized protein METZ01_LOCUS46788, partial [marine metagenome]